MYTTTAAFGTLFYLNDLDNTSASYQVTMLIVIVIKNM